MVEPEKKIEKQEPSPLERPLTEIEKALAESEDEFKKQFDPNFIYYHNGDARPVPIGGNRIPASMPTVFDENAKQEAEPENVNYGPEYDERYALREHLSNLKKVLSNVVKPLEAILRHRETFEKKGNPDNKSHLEKLQQNVDEEVVKLKGVIKDLLPLIDIIQKTEFSDKYTQTLKEIVEQSQSDYKNKEDLMEYAFRVKKTAQSVFADMGKILEQMKKIKKEKQAGK